jgi:hypothetical protein
MSQSRRHLLNSASLIAWDEALSNHEKHFSMVYSELVGNIEIQTAESRAPRVFLLMGDNAQIAPVIKYGTRNQIIAASLATASLFQRFHLHRFSINIRLLIKTDYADMLLEVGGGNCFKETSALSINSDTEEQLIQIPCLNTTFSVENVTAFLYSTGFNPETMHTKCILASTLVEYLARIHY